MTSMMLAVVVCVTHLALLAQETFMGVPEIAEPDLPMIATLQMRADGAQRILYNPTRCEEIGKEVCGFYRWHERGHVALDHARNKVPSSISEPEADCWAAKNVPLEWAIAAYGWFWDGKESPEVHESSAKRAEKIKECAGF